MSVSIVANYRLLLSSEKSQVQLSLTQIEIVANKELKVNYCSRTKGISKYKKVSKVKKSLLITYIVSEGRSIIEVNHTLIQSAKVLGINYSTAKSIILNHKKRKVQHSELDTISELNSAKISYH